MKQNKLLIILIGTIVGFFSFLLILSLIYQANRVEEYYQGNNSNRTPILQPSFVSGEVNYPGENLYLVFVNLDNPNLQNNDKLNFSVSENSQKLVDIPFTGQNVGYNDWVKFQFPMLQNTQGKNITIKLESNSETKDGAIFAGTNQQNQLALKMYSKGDVIDILGNDLSDFSKRLFEDKIFLGIYVCILFFTGGLLITKKYA